MEDTTTSGALDPSGEAVAQPKAAPETNGTVKKGLCCFSTSKDPKDNFGSCLKDALRKTDRNVLRLSNLISASYGEEAIFAIVGYFADIIHHALFSPSVRSILNRLRIRLGHVSPGPSKEASTSQTPPLLALASLISETRTALRLLGLIPLWEWGSATVKSPPTDPVLRSVAFAQVFVNVVYQFMENVAFLASKGVISQRFLQRWGGVGKWYIWSTRAWLGHVVLEFVRLWRERALARKHRRFQVLESHAEKTMEQDRAAEALRTRAWRKSLLNNLGWFPLCVHWSLEKGAGVPDNMIGLISFIANAWKVADLWRATAKAL